MTYKEKLEKIRKLNKRHIWEKLDYYGLVGRQMLLRWRNGGHGDDLRARFEQSIKLVYQTQNVYDTITFTENMSNGVQVHLQKDDVTKIDFILFTELMEFKLLSTNDYFENDVEYMKANSREEFLQINHKSPGEYKRLIAGYILKHW